MKTVLFINKRAGLNRYLGGHSDSFRFINLDETSRGESVSDYLRDIPGSIELLKGELYRERSQEFRESYIEFMSKVNIANSSIKWWAMSFTNKQPLNNPLCRNAFDLLLITDLVEVEDTPLVVVTSSPDLRVQFKIWGESKGITVVDQIEIPSRIRWFLLNRSPVGLLHMIAKTIALWVIASSLRPVNKSDPSQTVIATHTHLHSFDQIGGFKDVYFGPLVQDAAHLGRSVMVLALMYDHPLQQIKLMKGLNFELPVFPVESCLSIKSIFLMAIRAFIAYFRPTKIEDGLLFQDRNVGYLVNRSIRQSINSGEYFNNLKVLYSAQWLSANVSLISCIYPYEARSWEKLLMLGLKTELPNIKTIGYQHTSFSLHHTHLCLGLNEYLVTPLPDLLMTCGEITHSWLKENGGYPPNLVKPGCALRFSRIENGEKYIGNIPVKNILIVLGTSQQEYVSTPRFVEKALAHFIEDYEVRVRPHPSLSEFHFSPTSFLSRSDGTLMEDLEWADVVLYSSSTVSMEAISVGIPVIYVDLGDFLDTDPLLGFDDFKWTVVAPEELHCALTEISSIGQKDLEILRESGKGYVDRYLKPVTGEALDLFWRT